MSKDIKFTIMYDEEKHQVSIYGKLRRVSVNYQNSLMEEFLQL